MDKIECPYCKHEFCHSGDPYDQEEQREEQCPKCDEYFMVQCTYYHYYESWKIENQDIVCTNSFHQSLSQDLSSITRDRKAKNVCPECGKNNALDLYFF